MKLRETLAKRWEQRSCALNNSRPRCAHTKSQDLRFPEGGGGLADRQERHRLTGVVAKVATETQGSEATGGHQGKSPTGLPTELRLEPTLPADDVTTRVTRDRGRWLLVSLEWTVIPLLRATSCSVTTHGCGFFFLLRRRYRCGQGQSCSSVGFSSFVSQTFIKAPPRGGNRGEPWGRQDEQGTDVPSFPRHTPGRRGGGKGPQPRHQGETSGCALHSGETLKAAGRS